jgi:hypothetical protein
MASCVRPAHARLPARARMHAMNASVACQRRGARRSRQGACTQASACAACRTPPPTHTHTVAVTHTHAPTQHARAPVIISHSSTPNAYTSHAGDSSPSRMVSGAWERRVWDPHGSQHARGWQRRRGLHKPRGTDCAACGCRKKRAPGRRTGKGTGARAQRSAARTMCVTVP